MMHLQAFAAPHTWDVIGSIAITRDRFSRFYANGQRIALIHEDGAFTTLRCSDGNDHYVATSDWGTVARMPPNDGATTPPRMVALDHLVLTVADIAATCAFYQTVLGMRVEQFGDGRTALHFGQQKINLHQRGHEFEPAAAAPTPGSADLCLLTASPLEEVQHHLAACAVTIIAGPVTRTGAQGPMTSLYIRDPDGNLVEIARLHRR